MSVHSILSVVQYVYAVPQGSVLSPLVFTMYTHPLGIIAQQYGNKYQIPDNELNFSSTLKNLNIVLLIFGYG